MFNYKMIPISIVGKIFVTAMIVFATSYILPGFNIQSFWTAIVVALVLGVLNATVKPILLILTIPITLATLGLFSLVISAVILLLTSAIVPGFSITPAWMAIPAAIIIAVFSIFASNLK